MGPLAVSALPRRLSQADTHSSLRLIFARQLLQMGILVVRGICGHVEVGVAMLVAWVMASVVIIAPGSKDRRADSKR